MPPSVPRSFALVTPASSVGPSVGFIRGLKLSSRSWVIDPNPSANPTLPMKSQLLAFLSLTLFAPAISHAGEYAFKEPFTRSAAFNPAGEVSLENVNGNITVRAWDKNEILIEGEKSAASADELKAVDLILAIAADRASINVHLPKRSGGWFGGNTVRASVDFTVTVPRSAVLRKIATVNGNVAIDDARGAVYASTVNGGIHATGLGGKVEFSTVNGSIHASFAVIPASGKFSCKTVNGGIAITLPPDAGVQVQAGTVNGGIDCTAPLNPGSNVRRSHLSGTIGDGRATLRASTVNGGIRIEQR